MNDKNSRTVICQVLHTLEIGGAEVLAARLARQLRDRYAFVFACLDGLGTLGRELREEGFTVEVFGRREGFDVQCVRRLAAFAREQRADVIHAHQYTPFFYSRAPGWIGRRPPVLFTEHGRFHPDLPNRKRMVFNRLFLRGCDRVVAVGKAVKRALVANEGIPPARIDVIYNGVRLDDFLPSAAHRAAVRSELGIDPAAPVAIQVARLDYLKDHGTALRTAAKVREKLPGFQLILVGEGPERPKIEAQIADLGLAGTVRMLGLRTDIPRLLAAADVFLLTSISEGIPVTLIEAMGAELPVVSTDVGGVGEVVAGQETGLLVVGGDSQRLSEATLELLCDPDRRRALGQAARRRAVELFAEAAMHRQYASVYEALSRRTNARLMQAAL